MIWKTIVSLIVTFTIDIYCEQNFWKNIEKNSSVDVVGIPCDEAKLKCALRDGCGAALQNYMLGCSDVIHGTIDYCDSDCRLALIALTSTQEGHAMMDCYCSDEFCAKTKFRVDVCRPEVMKATLNGSIVSCNVAHWICSVDTLCSTALDYYEKFCRRMFIGKSCSFRCNNSIAILLRQDKATKLSSCVCDGSEPFNCFQIKDNMNKLCFPNQTSEEETDNEIDTVSVTSNAPGHKGQFGLSATAMVYVTMTTAVRWMLKKSQCFCD